VVVVGSSAKRKTFLNSHVTRLDLHTQNATGFKDRTNDQALRKKGPSYFIIVNYKFYVILIKTHFLINQTK
jgi:hypothetical protein